jgi:electron transfer flavoprotein beta subunit
LNIVVCMKQVPDTSADKKLTADYRMDRDSVENIMNPFDEYALEEAIRNKEASGAEVTLLTMGKPGAEDAIRRGLAMGADRAVLVTDPALAGSDALSTAYVLATALKKMQWDVVLCGMQSTDGYCSLVPGALAGFLDLPQLTYCSKVEFTSSGVRVNRLSDAGYDVVEGPLPAIISVVKAINEPRYPALKGIMQAKKKEVLQWSLADLGLDASQAGKPGAKENVLTAERRPPRTAGRVISDENGTAAVEIADYLAEKKLI